ncbi:hypothetical protein SLITO_v1c02840 [Spiroplasma litorale]|uniref:Transmembrane protein n=1 Tax=Spiroplasma litorale TaxID=216942 RepID=A0A0K1W0U0_9MOLU|nr:hypothetical protein [Spiroplasma litorale]AKX33939.1 hypothetical protein SLITO_v1c02840 [Spiroplasma litorale]
MNSFKIKITISIFFFFVLVILFLNYFKIDEVIIGNISIEKKLDYFDQLVNEYYIVSKEKININKIEKVEAIVDTYKVSINSDKLLLVNGLIKIEDEILFTNAKNNDYIYIYLGKISIFSYLLYG